MDKKPLTQEIAAVLRDEILRGQYRVGERLPSERDLAERFQVTRGVVRVAVNRLEQLGLADIKPGGARVAPLENASLDVIGHLLDLEHPPDPRVVSQLLEAHRGVASAAMRLGVERATDDQIARALALIAKTLASRTPPDEQQHLELEINEIFVEASDNLALKILRRGLSMQFMGRLQEEGLELRPARAKMLPHLRALARALEARDAEGAANAMYAGMQLVNEQVLSALRACRETPGREGLFGARK